MKTALLYGVGISVAGAIVILVEFFLGLHNDPAKFQAGQWIGTIVGPLITIVGLVFGIRAVREGTPDRSLSYGRGVGTGTLIGLFSGLCGAVFFFIYGNFINPEYHELLFQYTRDKQEAAMRARGMNTAALDQMEGMMRFLTGVTWMSLMAIVGSVVICLVVALIASAFLKRAPAAAAPPPIRAGA